MFEFERMMAVYEWLAGWSLRTRLVLVGLLAVVALAAQLLAPGTAIWVMCAVLAAIVLLPLLFGADGG